MIAAQQVDSNMFHLKERCCVLIYTFRPPSSTQQLAEVFLENKHPPAHVTVPI